MVKGVLCCRYEEPSSGEEVEDRSAKSLSHVGHAAYDMLRKHHNHYHHVLWNVTSASVKGDLRQTPTPGWKMTEDPGEGHDNWLPQQMAAVMSKTQHWCDVTSLAPPDGLFMEEFKKALTTICETSKGKEQPIVVRLLFGNIVGMPVNCTAVIKEVTRDLPQDHNIHLWVGAWIRKVSWNHSKIIAVDGQHLFTGGHNLYEEVYLDKDPIHDLSIELEGRAAHDGHLYANGQWLFIQKTQDTIVGSVIDKLPDGMPIPVTRSRVTVSEFPRGVATIFPPQYDKHNYPRKESPPDSVPIISVGRYGSLLFKARPSDDAFRAMFRSARTIIRIAQQDLGPVCIAGTKVPLPGCVWPKAYFKELARVMWTKGVDVEICLSNPHSIPGDLDPNGEPNGEAYGNGWTCVDVASELIKRIKKMYPSAKDTDLRKVVADNLRVCFIREPFGNKWQDGRTMGMHAKHFIVDDMCCYIGSQNLYICDLAEYGVIVDDKETVKGFMKQYWEPMWKASYNEEEDCDVQEVMDGLKIDRNPEHHHFNHPTLQDMEQAARSQVKLPKQSALFEEAPDIRSSKTSAKSSNRN